MKTVGDRGCRSDDKDDDIQPVGDRGGDDEGSMTFDDIQPIRRCAPIKLACLLA